jgi:hypothetical protein
MNDTGELSPAREVFCVIKYILENLLNYPLTSSSTSWYRIILKLHTYCSIIQTDFVYLPLRFFLCPTQAQLVVWIRAFTNTDEATTPSNDQSRGTRGGACWYFVYWAICWLTLSVC